MIKQKSTIYYLQFNLQFFAKDGPGGEKTEQATTKHLIDARKDGKVAKSQELTSGVSLIMLFVVLKVFMSYLYANFVETFVLFFNKMDDLLKDSVGGFKIKNATYITNEAILSMAKLLLPILIIAVIVTFLVSLVQVHWKPTVKPMQPKFSKMSPASGFKKMFSKDSLFELVKSITKIVLILMVAYLSVKKRENELFILYDLTLEQALAIIGDLVIDAGLQIAIIYLFLGMIDYIYQRHKFNNEMKMTKQEIKDEFKNSEGNPDIKGKQKQRMREASQRRMMADVPKADVIITNPTHLSVAISYNPDSASAPVVVAKGENHLAFKIREIAKEHDIDIIENKPVARMLYANVDIGEEVPPELYQAVAEILAIIYNKKHMS